VTLPSGRALAVCTTVLYIYNPATSGQEKHATEKQTAERNSKAQIQMKSVNFRLGEDIALEIRSLRGQPGSGSQREWLCLARG
jgi:hypothetical protein